MLTKHDLNGTPYLEVFCCVNSDHIFLRPDVPKEDIKTMSEALDVDPVELSISSSFLLGSLMVVNSTGAILTSYAEDSEIRILEEFLQVARLEDKYNAAGNNILANDSFALINPDLNSNSVSLIEDVLVVSSHSGTITSYKTVGSAGISTNKGLLCHPRTEPNELAQLAYYFDVPAQIATANYGVGNIGACMVANDFGALVGTPTTPIELGRIEETLQLY